MKTINYLWAVLTMATLSLTACSDESEDVQQPQEKNAKVELTLTGTPAETRASGALPSSEGAIKTLAVGIFDHTSGTTNTIAEPTLSDGKYEISCTPDTCDIIVVANAPTGTFAGLTTKDAFIAKTVALSQTAGDVQNAENLPMSGKEEGVVLTAGNTVPQSISISRLVARICINSIKTNFVPTGQYSKATFKLKKVFLHNAMASSQVTPEAVPDTSNPQSGQNDNLNKYLQTVSSSEDIITTEAPHTTNYWFYTFANTAAGMTSKHTKLVIYEEFDPDGAGGIDHSDVYYPVVINKLQRESSLKRSDQYHHRYSRQR